MYLTTRPIAPEQFAAENADSLSVLSAISFERVPSRWEERPVRVFQCEAYEEMAEKLIGRIVSSGFSQWHVGNLRFVHRLGTLRPGDTLLALEVKARVLAAAYEASRYFLQEIATAVPIWKKICFEDGTGKWLPSDPQLSLRASS